MQRRFSLVGLATSSICFVVFAGIWYALNYLGNEYNNFATEGPSAAASSYPTVISAQDLLLWLGILALGFAFLMLLLEFGHIAAAIISTRTRRQRD